MESNDYIVMSTNTHNALLNFIAKQPYDKVAHLITNILNEKEENSKKFTITPIMTPASDD